jgi:hypothetical protein
MPESLMGNVGMMKIDVRVPVSVLGGHWVFVGGGYGSGFWKDDPIMMSRIAVVIDSARLRFVVMVNVMMVRM